MKSMKRKTEYKKILLDNNDRIYTTEMSIDRMSRNSSVKYMATP